MSDFDWDLKNEEHILRHDVEIYEAEEAMTDSERIGFDVHDRKARRAFWGKQRMVDFSLLSIPYGVEYTA